MDCLSSEDLKGRRLNSLYLTAYAESWCCQAGNARDRGWQRPKQTEQQTGTIRRRSHKHRINWTRLLILALRWLPQPRALHPFPDSCPYRKLDLGKKGEAK
jgi:hypothetical protein